MQGCREQCAKPRRKTVPVVFSLQFQLKLQRRLSLYRPFHVSTSSISADGSERLKSGILLYGGLQNLECRGFTSL